MDARALEIKMVGKEPKYFKMRREISFRGCAYQSQALT